MSRPWNWPPTHLSAAAAKQLSALFAADEPGYVPQLEAAGYTTVLQAWDFRPGSDFLHQMQQATSTAGRTIAVLSPAYFGSEFSEAEWRAAFVKDPTGERGLLVPVRVQDGEGMDLAVGTMIELPRACFVADRIAADEFLLSLCR